MAGPEESVIRGRAEEEIQAEPAGAGVCASMSADGAVSAISGSAANAAAARTASGKQRRRDALSKYDGESRFHVRQRTLPVTAEDGRYSAADGTASSPDTADGAGHVVSGQVEHSATAASIIEPDHGASKHGQLEADFAISTNAARLRTVTGGHELGSVSAGAGTNLLERVPASAAGVAVQSAAGALRVAAHPHQHGHAGDQHSPAADAHSVVAVHALSSAAGVHPHRF